MPYEIHRHAGFIEVDVQGETSEHEVLAAVIDVHGLDPRKELCDLWVMSEESVVPMAAFPKMVAAIQDLCPTDLVGNRTAIVASNQFQRAALSMYEAEAKALPFDVRVFSDREEAAEWLALENRTEMQSPS